MFNLIRALHKKGILTVDQVTSLELKVKKLKQKEEEILVKEKIISESSLFKLKSELINVPLKETIIEEEALLEILQLIPKNSAEYYKMIPLGKKGEKIEIGMVYPEEAKGKEALKFLAWQGNFSYDVFLISLSFFKKVFGKYKASKDELTKALEEIEEEFDVGEAEEGSQESDAQKLNIEAPIIKIVTAILRQGVEGNASDIHIEPTKDQLKIRFRLNGILFSSLLLPMKAHLAVIARIKILAHLKIDESRIPQDGRFSTRVGGKDIDFRVSTFPTILGEKIVIRILDPITGLIGFNKLGLRERDLRVIKKTIKEAYGLILTTGPTGCGKTTTLYTILDLLNTSEVNIMTLEDPVEYSIPEINQSQAREDIGYSFASGLRYMLRQDPDIMMIGEIRDSETAELVTHSALTGHIVLSTLHTTNALGAIPRLIDLGIKPFLIPSTVSAVIAQRLARKLCPACKKKYEAGGEVKEMILKEIEAIKAVSKEPIGFKEPFFLYQPKGCGECKKTGYSGRIGIFEILTMTDELAEIVIKDFSRAQMTAEAKQQGMTTMKQDGILKALEGITSIEEVLRVAEEK